MSREGRNTGFLRRKPSDTGEPLNMRKNASTHRIRGNGDIDSNPVSITLDGRGIIVTYRGHRYTVQPTATSNGYLLFDARPHGQEKPEARGWTIWDAIEACIENIKSGKG